jgi:hypothetical protein
MAEADRELDDLAGRIGRLTADVQRALIDRVLRGLGHSPPTSEWTAAMQAEIHALLTWEQAGGAPPGEYRAAG